MNYFVKHFDSSKNAKDISRAKEKYKIDNNHIIIKDDNFLIRRTRNVIHNKI